MRVDLFFFGKKNVYLQACKKYQMSMTIFGECNRLQINEKLYLVISRLYNPSIAFENLYKLGIEEIKRTVLLCACCDYYSQN